MADPNPQATRGRIRGDRLTDREVEVLRRLEAGEHTFRRGTQPSAGRLEALLEVLQALREQGLVRFPDSRVMTREDGTILGVGPCDITAEGRAALAQDRSLGPRQG